MAARDVFHQAVRQALVKDQWRITDDPLLLQVGGVDMYVDLGAEKLLAAEKDQQQIAVEIKSFLGPSLISDFHLALGQFLNYRLALTQQDPERRLYLAVPSEIFSTFFTLPFIQSAIHQNQLLIIVYQIVSRSFRGVGTVVFGVITNDDQVKDNKATDGVGKGTNLI